MNRLVLAAALGLGALPALPTRAAAQDPASRSQGFSHPAHAGLFPVCVTCHEGAADPSRSLWPEPATCGNCHDGTVQPSVSWRPPTTSRPDNLRFEHDAHRAALARTRGPDAAGSASCVTCHTDPDAPMRAVQFAAQEHCLSCHGIATAHLDAPAAACATCHQPLAGAAELSRAAISRFPAPRSHGEPGFGTEGGHGTLAVSGLASCATCHARNFCASCHVDAPENRAIQALEEDPRSLAIEARLAAPPSHRSADFLREHGERFRAAEGNCAACHTRQSCLTCHEATPRLVASLPEAGPGRGAGAVLTRRAPATHVPSFRDRHGPNAAAMPASCSSCHTRNQCFDCHRPSAAQAATSGYHPRGFLERHPTAAYSRETSCSDCHNQAAFCATCHRQAGLMARTPVGSGYHDAKRFFVVGHGVAARQSLESCVSCHAERDCLACHSALGGRRFNPHGPGFDADRLRRKNPEVCLACHGTAIPGAP